MIEFIFHINKGRLLETGTVTKLFRQLKDGKHLLTIQDYRKRSLHQNAYYWGVVVPLIRRGLYEAGYDDVRTNDDAHEVLKHVHLKRSMVNKQTGEMIEVAGSTAKLNIPEFNEYIETVCRWAAEYLGIVIPDPNEPLVEFEEWEKQILEKYD